MKIRLYWWQEKRKDGRENYGDLMSKYLIEKISNSTVKTVTHPSRRLYKYLLKHYISIGSIISSANENSIVWGSGIIKKDDNIRDAEFLAVRGPKTRKRILEKGFNCPEVYGDPALLMPEYYSSKIDKKYSIGVIPHYVDYKEVKKQFVNNSSVKVIDLLTFNVEKTTDEILECKYIISSSLHGVIVAQSYNIPALWVKFSNKLSGDNIKFYDYYASVGIPFKDEIFIKPMDLNEVLINKILNKNKTLLLADTVLQKKCKRDLMKSCPF
ncbi:polysaccharide pyruvyl transferase family protein [Hyunsoonleella pacifica]|uniref:Polysaccharide pyruvyl transferase family protein n=1 Tax=Hyunsoonleella pacifica TaxID=1080224 RepID=A0A4Q9FR75_9FLAO|nr:polysaccharide pyruvyl transferase family protein [Hyunsoonleella pacifica]TBN18504.1 polysaccharide pyruvyl transferase family protein [Hyunsoonleella pacifica]GGD02356.1 GumL protein [Hyunsoonleella pacifica]